MATIRLDLSDVFATNIPGRAIQQCLECALKAKGADRPGSSGSSSSSLGAF